MSKFVRKIRNVFYYKLFSPAAYCVFQTQAYSINLATGNNEYTHTHTHTRTDRKKVLHLKKQV